MRRAIGAVLMMATGVTSAWLLPAGPTTAQQPKPAGPRLDNERQAVAVESIDPRGEAKAAKMRAVESPSVGLTYERDGWQVQCRPGAADWTRIDGTIEVVGGEIARVSGFGDLETSSRGGKNEHVDQGKFDQRKIEFRIWVKKGGTDTFRFYVSDSSQTLRFRFRIGNKPTADAVFIGKNGRHPTQADFGLDAHPERRPAG